MNETEFYELSDRNYAEQASKLVAEGWEMRRWADSIIPATFHKEVHGKERILYLTTDFGVPLWHPRQLSNLWPEPNCEEE